MFVPRIPQRGSGTPVLGGMALLLLLGLPGSARALRGSADQKNPWSMSQVIQSADLAKELGKGSKPEIVCVGFNALYRSAHIPGAVYHGPALEPQGLEDLKKWARGIARGQRIVLYCGCCPMNHCPNMRPAFQALKEMGFTHLQILSLPENLGRDWVDKGFPVEKAR